MPLRAGRSFAQSPVGSGPLPVSREVDAAHTQAYRRNRRQV